LPKGDLNHTLIALLIVALIILAGCSHLKRLKTPFVGGVDKRVQDKEVIRIDKQVYVKVPNPDAQKEKDLYGRYIYIPVKEYLANRESYDAVVPPAPISEEEEWRPVELDTAPVSSPEEPERTEAVEVRLHFRKKVMVVPFKDTANPSHKGLSHVVTESLASKIEAMSGRVILFDAEILRRTLEERGLASEPFDSPETVRLASQLYNVHALVVGTIDHVFSSSTQSRVKGKGKTTYAIAEVTAQLIDSTSGRVRDTWEKRNSIFDSEEKGDFSDEKAQVKAMELIASELAGDIIEELKRINWHTTIASVSGNRVYVSAGKLSGVRVGDVFSVYPSASPGDPKGEIRVATLFGIDASMADVTGGSGFRTDDLVRPVFR
jgi:TolB-like protein